MEVLLFLQSLRNPVLNAVFIGITTIGSEFFYMVVLSAVYWSISKGAGYVSLIAFSLTGYTNTYLKDLFMVERPIGKDGLISLHAGSAPGYSFPSGHSQFSATVWTSLAMLFRNRAFSILAAVITFLVGLSRLYLGVHWPTDVLGGFAIGAAIAWAVVWYSARVEKRASAANPIPRSTRSSDHELLTTLLFATMAAVVLLLVYHAPDGWKAVGALHGLVVGASLERRLVGFSVEGSVVHKVYRSVIGLAGLLVIYVVGKRLFPAADPFYLIRYMLLSMWVVLGAPYAFGLLGLARLSGPRIGR